VSDDRRIATASVWLALVMLLMLTVVIYVPGLPGPLLLDDYSVLVPLLELPREAFFSREYLVSNSGPLGRPLSMFTFALQATAGTADAWHWKAANVALHGLIGTALYALFSTTLGLIYPCRRRARTVALLAAAAWLVHPLHVSTVLYAVQRMTELSALFCVLGLLAYASGRARVVKGYKGGESLIVCGIFVMTPLAALSKETGLLLPFYIAALELLAFASLARPLWLKRLLWLCTVVPVLAAAAYIGSDIKARLLGIYTHRDFTIGERLMTQGRVLTTYLRWIVAPRSRDFGFYHDDEVVVRDLAEEPAVIAAFAFLLSLMALAWATRKRYPVAAFGVALFFLGHALESSVFGLELMYEHRNYLPMAGVYIALADVIGGRLSARLLTVAGLGLVAVLAVSTAVRTSLWGDERSLYFSAAERHPKSVRAVQSLAEWHSRRGEHDAALALLPDTGGFQTGLQRQVILCRRDAAADGSAAQTLVAAQHAKRVNNFALASLFVLVNHQLDGSCELPNDDLSATLRALDNKPLNRTYRYRQNSYLGMLLYRQGHVAEAFKRLRMAADSQPNEPFVHYLMAEWHLDDGQHLAAREALIAARNQAGKQRYPAIDRALSEWLEETSGPAN
jgi:protein O-mannosyl-transferase